MNKKDFDCLEIGGWYKYMNPKSIPPPLYKIKNGKLFFINPNPMALWTNPIYVYLGLTTFKEKLRVLKNINKFERNTPPHLPHWNLGMINCPFKALKRKFMYNNELYFLAEEHLYIFNATYELIKE